MRLSFSIPTAVALIFAGTVAVRAETIVQSVEVAASGSPAGVNMPECRNGELDIPREAIKLAGVAISNYIGSPLPAAIADNPQFNAWAQARLGIHSGGSICGRLCFVVPANATVHPTASTVQVSSFDKSNRPAQYSWGPGPIHIVNRFHVHDLQNWSGFTGPAISESGDTQIMCWTAMNWSHDLKRVFKITLVYN